MLIPTTTYAVKTKYSPGYLESEFTKQNVTDVN
ncbi:MAG: hypothetical protein JWQ96_2403 [Segetibacter sp.]|nr:hypothetical protein [Segetibacter sp.]